MHHRGKGGSQAGKGAEALARPADHLKGVGEGG